MINSDSPLINEILSIGGYAYGLQSASLIFDLRLDRLSNIGNIANLNSVFCSCLLDIDRSYEQILNLREVVIDLPGQLIYWLWVFQQAANIPQVACGRQIELDQNTFCKILVPAHLGCHGLISQMAKWVIRLAQIEDVDFLRAEIKTKLPLFMGQLRQHSPSASNAPYFLAAAADLDIPVQKVVGKILQFGQSCKARWLDSSFSDQTSVIGATIARNKQWTTKVLFDAGLPVPLNRIIEDYEQALNSVKIIGFPVVIKPADRDGGVGVSSGLTNFNQVKQAFDNAKKFSNIVMLEKHIDGRDYRLVVFQGKLLWAIERVPGGVIGDGKHCIGALVELLNNDPLRADGNKAKLKKILLDEEALGLLQARGKNINSILDDGEFIPLRRRANIASGGIPVAVMDKVHPDNAKLAIRATAALGLDIAGVDLLIPDITKSWMETGGAICEVNGQPQLGSLTSIHLYKQILELLMFNGSRIPITVVIGASDEVIFQKIHSEYVKGEVCVGLSMAKGLFVGDECIFNKPMTPYKAGKVLLLNRSVEAIILGINDFSILRTGLPFDWCNRVVIAGNHFHNPDTQISINADRAIAQMIKMIDAGQVDYDLE